MPAQPRRDDDDGHFPGHQWGHPNSLCFESPRLDSYVPFRPSSKLKVPYKSSLLSCFVYKSGQLSPRKRHLPTGPSFLGNHCCLWNLPHLELCRSVHESDLSSEGVCPGVSRARAETRKKEGPHSQLVAQRNKEKLTISTRFALCQRNSHRARKEARGHAPVRTHIQRPRTFADVCGRCSGGIIPTWARSGCGASSW